MQKTGLSCSSNNQTLNSVLIGDTFLVDRMSPSYFVNPLADSVSKKAPSIDEEIMNLMSTSMDLKKPMEIFDEPMLLTPPVPPPLDIDNTLLGLGDNSISKKKFSVQLNENDFLESNDLFDCNLFDNNENQSESDSSFLWSE